jgi:hypothetical protein
VQITDLAKSAGKRPWLVVGFPSMITGVATLTVYLEPDATEALYDEVECCGSLRTTRQSSRNARRGQ